MNKKISDLCSVFVFTLLLMLLFSWAEDGRCSDGAVGSAYKIGAGDMILLTISAGGEQQSKTELPVSAKGDINLPFIGKLQASGHTMSELEALITHLLSEGYFVDPQVNIQMKEFHSLQFFISGAVSKPGMYELNFYPSVMDMIAKAGGVITGRGNIAYVLKKSRGDIDLTHLDAEIKRAGSEPIRVDLIRLLDQGDMSDNIKLESGDTVYIPLDKELNLTTSKVYVEGEVAKPGVFDYQPGLTALRACIMAGGFAKYAAPNRTKIIRNSESGEGQEIIKIDLEKVKDGDIPDFPLKPGDRITVPETWL